MVSKKKKSGSGKRIARREENKPKPEKREQAAAVPVEKKPGMPQRIQETDAGFGAIKIVVGVFVALMIGALILTRLSGHDEDSRGDKTQGEQCALTKECKKGYRCAQYGDDPRICMKGCFSDDSACDPGYTCTSTSYGASRKKIKIQPVCVEDARLR